MKRLEAWANEGGIMLVMEQPEPHRITVKIVRARANAHSDDVLAEANMASFRWERFAEFLTTAKAEYDASLPHRVLGDQAPA